MEVLVVISLAVLIYLVILFRRNKKPKEPVVEIELSEEKRRSIVQDDKLLQRLLNLEQRAASLVFKEDKEAAKDFIMLREYDWEGGGEALIIPKVLLPYVDTIHYNLLHEYKEDIKSILFKDIPYGWESVINIQVLQNMNEWLKNPVLGGMPETLKKLRQCTPQARVHFMSALSHLPASEPLEEVTGTYEEDIFIGDPVKTANELVGNFFVRKTDPPQALKRYKKEELIDIAQGAGLQVKKSWPKQKLIDFIVQKRPDIAGELSKGYELYEPTPSVAAEKDIVLSIYKRLRVVSLFINILVSLMMWDKLKKTEREHVRYEWDYKFADRFFPHIYNRLPI